MPRSSAAPTSSASSQRRRHHTARRRHPSRAERRVGRLKEIQDAGIHRSAERWCPHHAAHRGSLNVPALPAGSRVERNALTPPAGTRSRKSRQREALGGSGVPNNRCVRASFGDDQETVLLIDRPHEHILSSPTLILDIGESYLDGQKSCSDRGGSPVPEHWPRDPLRWLSPCAA